MIFRVVIPGKFPIGQTILQRERSAQGAHAGQHNHPSTRDTRTRGVSLQSQLRRGAELARLFLCSIPQDSSKNLAGTTLRYGFNNPNPPTEVLMSCHSRLDPLLDFFFKRRAL